MSSNSFFYDGSVLPQTIENEKNDLASLFVITDEVRKQLSCTPYFVCKKD